MHSESEKPAFLPIEQMEFFNQLETASDRIWALVRKWDWLATETVGKQLIKASDRICATLVEGDGRFTDRDAVHFFTMARGSARETRYWLRRAVLRELTSEDLGSSLMSEVVSATRQLNQLIRYRRAKIAASSVHETPALYITDNNDPFIEEL